MLYVMLRDARSMSKSFLASSGKASEANPISLTILVMRSTRVKFLSPMLARDRLNVVFVAVLLNEKIMFRLRLFICMRVLNVSFVEPFGLGFAGVAYGLPVCQPKPSRVFEKVRWR